MARLINAHIKAHKMCETRRFEDKEQCVIYEPIESDAVSRVDRSFLDTHVVYAMTPSNARRLSRYLLVKADHGIALLQPL